MGFYHLFNNLELQFSPIYIFQPFNEEMITFFDHKNGGDLSLRGSACAVPSRDDPSSPRLPEGSSGPSGLLKHLSTVFGSFETCCSQEALSTWTVLMGHGPHTYLSLFYMLSFKPTLLKKSIFCHTIFLWIYVLPLLSQMSCRVLPSYDQDFPFKNLYFFGEGTLCECICFFKMSPFFSELS